MSSRYMNGGHVDLQCRAHLSENCIEQICIFMYSILMAWTMNLSPSAAASEHNTLKIWTTWYKGNGFFCIFFTFFSNLFSHHAEHFSMAFNIAFNAWWEYVSTSVFMYMHCFNSKFMFCNIKISIVNSGKCTKYQMYMRVYIWIYICGQVKQLQYYYCCMVWYGMVPCST